MSSAHPSLYISEVRADSAHLTKLTHKHTRTMQSGLTEACRSSQVSLAESEHQMLEFVREHVPQGRCPLAGNTVHMDKRFLDKYMPQLMAHLHYRIVDVSTVKELCRCVCVCVCVCVHLCVRVHLRIFVRQGENILCDLMSTCEHEACCTELIYRRS